VTLPGHLPVACDLGALSPEERAREAELLTEMKAVLGEPEETEKGFLFAVPQDPALVGRLGELLALERLCCPFLGFDLAVPAGRGRVTLHIHGDPAARSFIRSVFSR
jgi:hypothetical protein